MNKIRLILLSGLLVAILAATFFAYSQPAYAAATLGCYYGDECDLVNCVKCDAVRKWTKLCNEARYGECCDAFGNCWPIGCTCIGGWSYPHPCGVCANR